MKKRIQIKQGILGKLAGPKYGLARCKSRVD